MCHCEDNNRYEAIYNRHNYIINIKNQILEQLNIFISINEIKYLIWNITYGEDYLNVDVDNPFEYYLNIKINNNSMIPIDAYIKNFEIFSIMFKNFKPKKITFKLKPHLWSNPPYVENPTFHFPFHYNLYKNLWKLMKKKIDHLSKQKFLYLNIPIEIKLIKQCKK